MDSSFASRAPVATSPKPGRPLSAGTLRPVPCSRSSSPYTIAFWLGVNGMAFASNGSSVHAVGMGVFFSGFLLAAVVWGLFLTGVVIFGRRFVCQGLFRWMNLGCGLVLGYFGRSRLGSLLAQLLV